MNRQHDSMGEPPDGRANLRAAHRLRSVDRDLRRDPQASLFTRRDVDPRNSGVMQDAGERQYHDSRKRIEPVRLNDDSGPRLVAIPLQRNDDKVAATCQPRSSQASALTRSQNSVSVRPPSVLSAAAINSHWRRHSAAKPAALVSGTQIWTGRSPEARNLARRRLTRSALVSLSMAPHVARGHAPATPRSNDVPSRIGMHLFELGARKSEWRFRSITQLFSPMTRALVCNVADRRIPTTQRPWGGRAQVVEVPEMTFTPP